MKMMRNLHLLCVLLVLLASTVVFTATADAVTIHVLLVIDGGNPRNFDQHEASKDSIKLLLGQIKRTLKCSVQISELNTADSGSAFASNDNILKWITEVRVDTDDVVWVYFSGHGGVHSGTDDFYLSLPGEDVDRNRLAQKINGLSCRLKILTTDACSYSGDPVVNPSPPGLKAYRDLFYKHKGFFNVVAAAKGELAGGSPGGGWFTRGFMTALLAVQDADLNTDGFISWSEILKKTQRETDKLFQQEKHRFSSKWKKKMQDIGQTGQHPTALSPLPQRVYN